MAIALRNAEHFLSERRRRHPWVVPAPHPEVSVASRVCWLGGTPRWQHGLLSVSCGNGELYTVKAPSSLAEHLSLCHPSGWTGATAPPLTTFADHAWIDDRLRARGIVLV